MKEIALRQAVLEVTNAHIEDKVQQRTAESRETMDQLETFCHSVSHDLRAHKSTLIEVLLNLVSNALKFVKPGEQPQIRIRSEKVDGRVRLCVEDNGIGIDPKNFGRLFEMFQPLNSEYPGTGIGLAIVRKAVERMGGVVNVESEPGKGSRFWIELPAGTAALATVH